MLETFQVVNESVQWESSFTVRIDLLHDDLVVELVTTADTSKVIPAQQEMGRKVKKSKRIGERKQSIALLMCNVNFKILTLFSRQNTMVVLWEP